MAGLGIKLYTDEAVPAELCRQLQRSSYDAISSLGAGNSNRQPPLTDEAQLRYATSQNRAILTFNMADFLYLDRTWKATRRSHCGIIISAEIKNLGELLRRVRHHLDTIPPALQNDTLFWLQPAP